MSGKQVVTGGFDLNRFVEGASQPEIASSRGKNAAERSTPRVAAQKPIRKEKPAKELLSERVQLKVTVAEMALLKEKAGMAPLSAFLRKHLKDTDLI